MNSMVLKTQKFIIVPGTLQRKKGQKEDLADIENIKNIDLYFLTTRTRRVKLLNPTHNCKLVSIFGTNKSKGVDLLINFTTSQSKVNMKKSKYRKGTKERLVNFEVETLGRHHEKLIADHILTGGVEYKGNIRFAMGDLRSAVKQLYTMTDIEYQNFLLKKQRIVLTSLKSKNETNLKLEGKHFLKKDHKAENHRQLSQRRSSHILFSKLLVRGSKEQKLDLVGIESRKRLFSLKATFLQVSGYKYSYHLGRINYINFNGFSGASYFLSEALTGTKKVRYLKKKAPEKPEKIDFLWVFNFFSRSWFNLSLSDAQFIGLDKSANGVKENPRVDLVSSLDKTKYFAFMYGIYNQNEKDRGALKGQNGSKVTIRRTAKVKHLAVDIRPALSKKCKDEERSKEIKLKVLKEIELDFRLDLDFDIVEKKALFFRVDFNFRTLVPTERGEGFITFTDMEKLIRICEEYNETVREESRIRIDRSDVRAPISDYAYCLSATVVMVLGANLYNSPYVILIDKECENYVVIGLLELLSRGDEVANLILDSVL